jgi:hypothetical protein
MKANTGTMLDPKAPATLPAMADLVNAMRGADSTNGWDVVCSYTVAQLNSLLQAQYDAGALAKEVSLSTKTTDPLTDEDYTVSYDLRFSSPALSFIAGRSGFATLTMAIQDGSSYTVTPDGGQPKTKPIPGGKYNIEAVVPLAAMQGDDGPINNAGDVITFADGDSSLHHIIIHFKNEKGLTFQLNPPAAPQDKSALAITMMPLLVEYFTDNIKEIDYALTSITNAKPPDEDVTLTPKSFVFASWGAEDEGGTGAVGGLSLYIQTEGSGNQPGDANPSFQPDDRSIMPIPGGFTASIILSYDLMIQFFKASLQKDSFDVSVNTATDGISLELKSDESVVVVKSKDGSTIFGSNEYKGLKISMNDYPLNLLMKDSNIELAWQGKAKSDWIQVENVGEYDSAQYGTVDVTVTLNKAPVPLGALSEKDITLVNISIDKSDFSTHAKARSCSIGHKLLGCVDSVPDFYKDLDLKIADINLEIPNLNFFATTNLLSPGAHVIHIDSGSGIQTPHDFLLVGQVIKL